MKVQGCSWRSLRSCPVPGSTLLYFSMAILGLVPSPLRLRIGYQVTDMGGEQRVCVFSESGPRLSAPLPRACDASLTMKYCSLCIAAQIYDCCCWVCGGSWLTKLRCETVQVKAKWHWSGSVAPVFSQAAPFRETSSSKNLPHGVLGVFSSVLPRYR